MVSIVRRRMNNDRLETLIREMDPLVEGESGFWRFETGGRSVMVMTDESHNRMRVMTGIIEEERIPDEELKVLLEANFDRALDARFALSNDVLWAVFIHPLGELTDDQFHDAVRQVRTLADNYGGSYTSSDLTFGGG